MVLAPGFRLTEKLALPGITFHVTCPNDSSRPTLKITPSGLAIDNSAMTEEVDGHAVLAEVADLNVDGSPEIYVYVQSVGSGSYASLVAYSANKKKSLSEIYLPPITDDPRAAKGYMGHDEFRVVESTLVRGLPALRRALRARPDPAIEFGSGVVRPRPGPAFRAEQSGSNRPGEVVGRSCGADVGERPVVRSTG